jgi:Fe-Mn family superoxide dismutase
MDIKKYVDIIEAAQSSRELLVQDPLNYGREELDPVISKQTLDYHYGKLARSYVDRYNKQEGDSRFNLGGAVLHNIYFAGLRQPRPSNGPFGSAKTLIDLKFGDYDGFRDAFSEEFMRAQGSNWIYLDSKGAIKTIHNHEYNKSMEILLLFDGWEHAWALDYQHDKKRFLENFWRIVDWSVVNDRINS